MARIEILCTGNIVLEIVLATKIHLPLQHYLEALPFYDIPTILTRFIIFLNFFQIQQIRRFRQKDRGFNKFYLTAL